MPVPLPYRVLFTIFDIVLPLFGIYAHLFAADTMVLPGFSASFSWPPGAEMRVMLDATAGWLAAFATAQIVFLLYRPRDMLIWRTLAAGTLAQDLFMLVGLARGLQIEGKLQDTSLWRGDDWGQVGGYVVIALVRAAFLMGIGVGRDEDGRKDLKRA